MYACIQGIVLFFRELKQGFLFLTEAAINL